MKRSLRILLIEDSPDDALLLLRELRRGGFETDCVRVVCAEAMTEALKDRSWDVIISDYVIPGFGGMEALEIFREHGPNIPFIIISGQIGEEIAIAALKAGADDYIMKDRMARLVPAVTRALEEAQRRRDHRRANEALRESEERFRQLASFLDRRVQERTADLRAANLELQSQMDERKRLENELLEIAENERRRIGFDLHDDIGQRLMGLSMLVKALENKLEQRQLPDAATARRVSSLLDEVINHTHDLADWFSSLDLGARSLRDSLSTLAASVISRFEVQCHLHAIGPIPDFPPETALQLHKITQEAVGNAIKHGKASKIMLVAGVHQGHFMLQVRNDGVPYQPTEDVSQQLGFRIMNYRAHTIGGQLDIRSNGDSGGTMITCMLPMAGSAALAAAMPSVPLFEEPAPETPPVKAKNHRDRMADLTAA